MFGMLDYRAHKLLWLLCLPVTLAGKIVFYLVVLLSIFIAELTSYSVLVKIIIAYLAMEGICIVVFQIVFPLIFFVLKRFFFWFVDVIPSDGKDAEEAKQVVLMGKTFLLTRRFETEIENFGPDAVDELVATTNWRARWFFNARNRIEGVVRELQRIRQETGKEPGELGRKAIDDIREGLPNGHVTFVEKAIVTQAFFNSIVGFAICAAVISYIK